MLEDGFLATVSLGDVRVGQELVAACKLMVEKVAISSVAYQCRHVTTELRIRKAFGCPQEPKSSVMA